jgi:hypothetical protein
MTMKKMFDILSYKGNANQNDTQIPSHPVRMGIIKRKQLQMLVRIQRKSNPFTLLVGCKLVQPL